MSLSGDGKTLAVGAPGRSDRNDRQGYVKVFRVLVIGNNLARPSRVKH